MGGVPGSLVGVVVGFLTGRYAMAAPPARFAVITRQLTKRFSAVTALDRLDLEIPAGEVFGFLGPNGAGKSTTIRLLLGLLRPTSGTAQLFGLDAGLAAARRDVAYVPADVALWPQLSGAQTLELLANTGREVDRTYRTELIRRFELDVDRRCGTYSTGNRQKVALIAAFATRAPLLILDEPTSGLDPLMEQQFRRCVADATDRGQTVFLSSHHLAEVEAVCHRVGILRAGRLVEISHIADLRALRRTEIIARFLTRQPSRSLLTDTPGVVGVREVTIDTIAVAFTGGPGPVLRVITDSDPVSVQMREPSLEEIFLDYYGEPVG